MAYIFREKLNLNHLVGRDLSAKKIVMVEPEDYLLELHSRYLVLHNFHVENCPDTLLLHGILKQQLPHLLIANIEAAHMVQVIKSVRTHFPHLPVVTIGYSIEPHILKELMSAGISSHINRKLTRPQDLVVVVNAVLNNN